MYISFEDWDPKTQSEMAAWVLANAKEFKFAWREYYHPRASGGVGDDLIGANMDEESAMFFILKFGL